MPTVKFYDDNGCEVLDKPIPKDGPLPLINFSRWAKQRALDCTSDREKATSFLSDMGKHPTLSLLQRSIFVVMMGLKGKELDEFIKTFPVPGVKRVEYV
jgi:hypothetical protein